MLTKEEQEKWKEYKRRRDTLIEYGFKNGLVKEYDDETLKNLRSVSIGGVPGDIYIMSYTTTSGNCRKCARLATFAFPEDDFEIIDAIVDGVNLAPFNIEEFRGQDIEYGLHTFALRKNKNGLSWVYDTTHGLIIEKNLYFKIENPEVRRIITKEEFQDSEEYYEIKDADFETEKYLLPLSLPTIEEDASSLEHRYDRILLERIKELKEEIDYDEISKSFMEEMGEEGFGSFGM